VEPAQLQEIRLGEGNVKFAVNPKPDLFYRILSEECGYPIEDEGHLFLTVIKLVRAEREYSRVAEALRNAREKGYGMVQPDIVELMAGGAEIVKHGNRFGVRLKARRIRSTS
jgi:stage IV sporulation protein A